MTENAFATPIAAQRGRRGTQGGGDNRSRFDGEVTRFPFWRDLMDPFAPA